MPEETYLLVDATDTLVNSVVWDGDLSQWQPPAGLRAVKSADSWCDGWKWDGEKAYDPNPPAPEPEMPATPSSDGMTVI